MRFNKEKKLLEELLANACVNLRTYAAKQDRDTQLAIYQYVNEATAKIHPRKSSKRINRGPSSIKHFYEEVDDEKTQKRVIRLINHPNKSQIEQIIEKYEGHENKIAKKIGIYPSTYYQVKNNMLNGQAKVTYPHAQLAYWLLQQGYKLRQ